MLSIFRQPNKLCLNVYLKSDSSSLLPCNTAYKALLHPLQKRRGEAAGSPQVSLEQTRCGSSLQSHRPASQPPLRTLQPGSRRAGAVGGSTCAHRKGGTILDAKDLQPWQTLVTGDSVVCNLNSAV